MNSDNVVKGIVVMFAYGISAWIAWEIDPSIAILLGAILVIGVIIKLTESKEEA